MMHFFIFLKLAQMFCICRLQHQFKSREPYIWTVFHLFSFFLVCLFHQMINLPIPLFESTQFAKRAAALEMSICSNVRHHRKAKVNQDYPSHWIWSFEGLLSITKEIGLEKTQKSWKFFCCIFFFLLLNFECMNDHLGSSWWSQALEGHKFWQ